MKIKRGSTSVRRLIFVADSSSTTGAGLANLAYNTSGLVAYYFAGDLSDEVAITLASATLGTWTSGGFVAVDNTNMPGWYEIGIPNAALDGGNEVAIQFRGASNMVPVNIYIELDAIDYQAGKVAGVSGDVDGKVLGGGSGTISGVGARVVDYSGANVATAAALAAIGGGTGARSVTITINDGTTALQGATVRATKGAESYVQTTNASGVAAFSLDDGTWAVTIAQPGYSIAAQSLVVNGTESVTYSMTAVSVSTPSAPNMSVGTLLCLDSADEAEASAVVFFRKIAGPGTAGYSHDSAVVRVVANGSGVVEREFQIGSRYGVRRGTLQSPESTFTVPNASSFSIAEVIGEP